MKKVYFSSFRPLSFHLLSPLRQYAFTSMEWTVFFPSTFTMLSDIPLIISPVFLIRERLKQIEINSIHFVQFFSSLCYLFSLKL